MSMNTMASVLLLAFLLVAQDKPADKCTLSGTVTDSLTGAPLNKVQVVVEPLGNSNGPLAVASTDAKGIFSMVDLEPGQYRVKGVRNGYLDTYYGSRRGDSKGTTVALEAGRGVKDLQLKLLAYGVIAGAVRDPDGEPVVGAGVKVLRIVYRDGQRRVQDTDPITTDDLGQYRAADLMPGRYYVEAEPKELFNSFQPPVDHSSKNAQPPEILASAFYPGVADRAAARTVDVMSGARVTGIDIPLPRGRIYTISGHVTLPSGTTTSVNVGRPDSSAPEDRIAWADNVKGDFEIRGISTGSYVLRAWAEIPTTGAGFHRGYSAEIPFTVESADVTGLKLVLEPHPEITGQITILGEKQIALGQAFIMFGDGYGFPIRDDNSFRSAMTPGHYIISVASVAMRKDLIIKSIRSDQTDILREGITLIPGANVRLEIVLAPEGGQIEGTALDKNENPVAGATVVAVPDPSLRARPDRFYQASTDQHGRYQLTNVAPGDYKIFAWDDVEPGAWFDPEYLRSIEARGEPVKLEVKGHETAKVHVQ
jgi:Carboxypeptidase regulatory-like domain